jgi:aerobic carbon-monoxide dehydrogenase medium subunit
VVKPASFAYADPETLDEALDLMAEHGDTAKVLAGGQSLIPLMNLRLARPAYLVDINRIAGLRGIERDKGDLVVGATARHASVASSEKVRRAAPLAAEAASMIGHPQIRHRGTAGGSLAEADPAGQLPTAILALDGEVVARSVRGPRTIPAADLFTGFLATSLQPDEVISEIRIPAAPPASGSAFLEVTRRRGDFAMVGVAALVTLNSEGKVDEARIALAAMGPTPIRASAAEKALCGAVLTDEVVREVGDLAAGAGDPVDDVHATAVYRRRAAAVLTQRALRLALHRAAGEQS